MRKQLSRLARTSGVVRSVVGRRVRKGPHEHGWSLQYEVVIAFIRERFSRRVPIQAARRSMERIPDFGALRGLIAYDEVIGGVPCLRVAHPQADDRVLVYLHGGGYCVGSPRSHRPILAALAHAGRLRIVAVDYRLAPEHPCPAAIDDAVAVVRALLDAGVRPERLFLAGDSAGGGLTLTTLLALRDQGLPLPAAAVCISPWTNLAVASESAHAHVHDYLPGPEPLLEYAEAYAGALDRRDPRVSPLFADLRGLPPLLVLVGGAERLHDDGVGLVDRARAAGVRATLHLEPGEVHVWPMFHRFSPRAADAVRRMVDFLR